jgi:peptide/nickel transport system ATP-binding protein
MSLRVENLRIAYRTLRGDVVPVDDISFFLDDGEIMGLAGESGSGKSTLGNSLVRMDARMVQLGGAVTLDGEDLPISNSKSMSRFRFNQVSIVPQYAMSALNPTRKIGRMVADLLRSRDMNYREHLPEFERRIRLVGLDSEILDRYPIELSGGMKQRIVMVISTLMNPSLLIADEVTSALDVSTQREVGEMLLEFRDRTFVKSAIVITHDVSILAQVADTILVMYAGKLVEKAKTDVIIGAPRHPYTQMLISSLPEVGVRYADRRLVGIPGRPPSLLTPPQGCRFRERCPFAFDRCVYDPPFVEIEPGHSVACWLTDKSVPTDISSALTLERAALDQGVSNGVEVSSTSTGWTNNA